MTKLFVLLATIYTPDGIDHVYALDTGLTGEDCVERMIDVSEFMGDNVVLSCEFDMADDTYQADE